MSYEDECNEYYFGIPFKKRVSAAEPAKFRVGDRVQVVKDGKGGSGHGAEIGETYTLKSWREGEFWRTNGPDFYEDELAPAPTIAIGDRVKLKRHFGPHAVGDAGTVRELITKAGFVNAGVEMDPWGVYTVFPVEALEIAADCPQDNVQQDNVIKIELDTSALDEAIGKLRALTAPCIVARVLDGQPRPSNIPFVHASSADALTEAERLAKNNPGQEFAVYQRVGARVASVEYKMKEVA